MARGVAGGVAGGMAGGVVGGVAGLTGGSQLTRMRLGDRASADTNVGGVGRMSAEQRHKQPQ